MDTIAQNLIREIGMSSEQVILMRMVSADAQRKGMVMTS
jgi:hypothetical protein